MGTTQPIFQELRRESEMPAPSRFDHVPQQNQITHPIIAAHRCKKRKDGGTLSGNGACKDR